MDNNTLWTVLASILAPIGGGLLFVWRAILRSAKMEDAKIEERRANLEKKFDAYSANTDNTFKYVNTRAQIQEIDISALKVESLGHKSNIEFLRQELKEAVQQIRYDLHAEVAELKEMHREDAHFYRSQLQSIEATLRELMKSNK
jgi:hypothetical protein